MLAEQVTLFLQHDKGDGRREFASAAHAPGSANLELKYREPDQISQLNWAVAPAQSDVNATAIAATYDVRSCNSWETLPAEHDIRVCTYGTLLPTETQSDLGVAELSPDASEIYERDSTPRVLAVDPDEGPSVGGVLTTVTIDLGRVRVPNRPLTIEAIELVGSPCNLNAEPGVTGVLASLDAYNGKRPGYLGDWIDPVEAQGNIYQIKCVTGWYNSGRVNQYHTGRGLVHVLTNLGVAAYSIDAPYRYVDYWSSPTTWTNGKLPDEGASVFSTSWRYYEHKTAPGPHPSSPILTTLRALLTLLAAAQSTPAAQSCSTSRRPSSI